MKTILLKGVRDDCLDMLNMIGKGDISKESYEYIVNIVRDSLKDLQGISQLPGIPLFQGYKNQPMEGQQEKK
jgi:hypothetical protein